MKNLSLALNVVLLVAVAILYFLHFSSKNDASEKDPSMDAVSVENPSIVYINSDSLLSKYAMYDQIKLDLADEKTKLDKEFEVRVKGLEQQIADFQKNAPSMTMAQGKAGEEELMKKRQNLMQFQETLQQKLRSIESKATNELYDKVAAYLKNYSIENGVQMVLTYTKGSGVWYGSEDLDVTDKVIVGLNSEYNIENNIVSEPADTITNK